MGLDTSHNAWHGPYTSFGIFRKWLALQAGFNLYGMDGYNGTHGWTEEMKQANYYPLLNHSDCDGELSVEDCKKTKLFLEEVISKQGKKNDFETNLMIGYAANFLAGCISAIQANEPIDFH